MQIKVIKITTDELMRKACEFTTGRLSGVSLATMYQAEHSPIRTQLFWIEMYDIPTFVSTHLVRHKVGVEHFVKSNREDRGGDGEANRTTPVNHAMLINAQALITMSHRRLCNKAHKATQRVMEMIQNEIGKIDFDLADNMKPTCFYRGSICYEPKSCGLCPHIKNWKTNNYGR